MASHRTRRAVFVSLVASTLAACTFIQTADAQTELVLDHSDAEIIVAADRDRDGLPDSVEKLYGTDPDAPDTDGDGVLDGVEVETGTDPTVNEDRPILEALKRGDLLTIMTISRQAQLFGVPNPVDKYVEELGRIFQAKQEQAIQDALARKDLAALLSIARGASLTGVPSPTEKHQDEIAAIVEERQKALLEAVKKGDRRALPGLLGAIRQAALLGDEATQDRLVEIAVAIVSSQETPSSEPDPDQPAGAPASAEPAAGDDDEDDSGEQTDKTVASTSTTASQRDDDGHYTVEKVIRYSDGSSTKVVTEKDENDQVVAQTTTEYDADGNETSSKDTTAQARCTQQVPSDCTDTSGGQFPTDDQASCATAACAEIMARLQAFVGSPAIPPCAVDDCLPDPPLPDGGDGDMGFDSDGDGEPDLAGWLYALWGVVDPPPPGEDGGGAAGGDLDPCALDGCLPDPDPDLDKYGDAEGPIRDPNDTGPISNPVP